MTAQLYRKMRAVETSPNLRGDQTVFDKCPGSRMDNGYSAGSDASRVKFIPRADRSNQCRSVIPAKVGIQRRTTKTLDPAFAGTTAYPF